MTILREGVRQDILDRPCEKCGEQIDDAIDCILSFYRGSFILLHNECSDFIDTGQKGQRIG